MSRMIIGLTGMNAAGKGTVAEYLKTKGYISMSLSDMIRDELKKQGIAETRESLVKMGNDLRNRHGAGALAEMIAGRIAASSGDNFVIDSIRNPAEVQRLRKIPGFVLFGIDAPIAMRFDRAKLRGRLENAATIDDFKAQEDKEKSDVANNQQLHTCMKMIDLLIINNGTIDDLHKKIDLVIGNFARLTNLK